jgi:hypothetical protein
MNAFLLPETVASQLQGLPHPVNLCDPSGKTLGYFVPAVDPSLYEIDGPEPTQEELRDSEESSEWSTTDQVLRDLEKLR